MTLEELSKMNVKVWTHEGYKDLSKEELNEKIQLKLFEHRAFFWYGTKSKIFLSHVDALFSEKGRLTYLCNHLRRGSFDKCIYTEISIEDIIDYDDGGL